MKKTQRNVALILTSLIFLVCAIMGVVGLGRQQKVSLAEASYTSPLPTGAYIADYTVLDVNVGDLSGSAIKTQQAMGNASAVRFKLTATVGNTWNTYISLHSTNNYYTANTGAPNFYLTFRQSQNDAKTRTVDLKILTGNVAVNDVTNGTVSVYLPDWLNLSTAGATYNVEVGGVKVLRADGSKAGTLMYMDVDNARVVEYFYANDQFNFEGNNFNYEANQTAGSLTTYDQTIDASSATVAFANASYGANAQPIPLVTLVTEKGGSSYGRTLAPQDYDIVYANNDKTGTATATLTFKGRYTGTATATFEVEDVIGDAIANYTSPLPSGAYLEEYSVLDVADTYGTDGVLSYAAAGECSKSYRLNGARAIKLKFTQTQSPWSVRLGLFNTADGYLAPNNSSAHVELRNGLLDVLPNETVHNVNFTYPTGVTYYSSGTVTYEFGGPKVFNESGAYIGRLFYLEINGLRVVEYFFEHDGEDILNNDYFTIHDTLAAGKNSTVTITSPDVEDITDVAFVSLGESKITNGKATPEIKVLTVKEFASNVYVQEIEPQYYDVVYTGNDAEGEATASITFKGKYTGSASINFDVVAIDLTSDTDATQTVYALDGAPVEIGALTVAGRAFIGYEVDGELCSTATVDATEGASVKFVTVDFTTLNKASVRMFGTIGMRFLSSIASSDVEKLSNYGTVKFGTLITSPDKAGYIKIETENWVENGELVTADRDTFTAVLTGFNESYFTTRFTARAYVEITLDGGEVITAYAFVASEFTRTFAEVCYAAIDAGEITSDNPQYALFQQAADCYVAQ